MALDTSGEHADRVIAFARADDHGPQAVTIVPTHQVARWGDTAVVLPAGSWLNVFDDDAQPVTGGAPVRVTWFDRFPVALLDATNT